jgi:hypothetical protein
MLSKSKEEMLKLVSEKGESVIPKGYYCYKFLGTEKDDSGMPRMKTEICPYWDYDDEKDDQECGYCWFTGQSDWDENENKEVIDPKTGEKTTGNEIGMIVGLLWDQCKGCNVN